MKDAIIIRRLEPRDWNAYRTVRLRSLADSPDAFGSTWAAEHALPAGHWRDRLSAAATSDRDCPLIAECGAAPVGLVWAKTDPADQSLVNVFQMWVAPESRGRGVAAALLHGAVAWATSRHVRVVQLGVTCGDTPAARLYARAGFLPFGEPEPLRAGSELLSQTMRLALDSSISVLNLR